MKNRFSFFVLAVCLLIIAAVSAQASVIYVKTDGSDGNDGSTWALAKATIGGALSVASSGDEVWVKTGTYSLSTAIPTGVKLFGGFDGTETLLDSRNWGSNTTTINSGYITATVTSGSSAIDGFILTDLSGIDLTGDVTFSHNEVVDCDNIDPVISCTGVVKLVNNLIYNNNGYETRHESTCTITCASSNGDAIIVNNTISDNGFSDGGGAAIYCTGTPDIANNIIVFQAGNGIYDASAGTPTVSHNCVYGNAIANYQGFPINWQPDNDINVDPEFWDRPNDDYRLDRDSVCEEMGSNSYIDSSSGLPDYARTKDFWHHQRIATIVDIGAFESWD
ncbi:right-handed parallel beta-helix repeat-containing protein [bacterium]|nr:right-handed parallel beta-helix repeat-containing protein [bacterium]